MEGPGGYIDFEDVARKVSLGGNGDSNEPEDFSFQTDRLKAFVSWKRFELRARLALILTGGVVVAALSGVWGIAVLAILLTLATAGFAVFVARLPKVIGKSTFAMVCAFYALISCLFLALGLYLWMQPSMGLQLLSVLLLGAVMVSAISEHMPIMALSRIDGIAIIIGILLRAAWLPFTDMDPVEATIIGMTFLMVAAYFGICFKAAQKSVAAAADRQRLEGEDAKFLAVGRLTGGIAHDFNNMLTAVLGNLELSRLTTDPKETALLVAEAEASARRGAQLTRELLALSGRSHVTLATFDVGDIVKGAIGMVSDEKRSIAEIATQLADDLPRLRADRVLLSHALAKLMDNAIDAAGENGRVTVSASRSNIAEAQTVTITITDNGPGISEDMRPFVFEPYFTTKPVGEGSGLGLPMAKGVVEQLGGQLILSSKPGQGTEVMVHLPAA